MKNPYIPPASENEKIAKRLIEMGVFDCDEEDELKDTQIYFLQDWLINALDERIDYLSKRLQKEKETGRYQKSCHKWFKRWREAKKDALYFDSSLQKQIEATLKLQKDYQELEQKNHEILKNSLDISNQFDELEEKLANADYQLEGRDLKIKELEKELADAKKVQIVEHFEAYGQCRDSRRIAELEAQIEKLKCCNNCALYQCEKWNSGEVNYHYEKCDKWEIKEK